MPSSKKKTVKKKSDKSTKRREWVCSVCPGWKNNPHVCKHLEELISKDRQTRSVSKDKEFSPTKLDEFVGRNMNEVVWDYGVSPSAETLDPANVIVPESISSGQDEEDFRKKLLEYGLHPLQAEIVIRRFFYEMTLRDIATELNIISPSTVLNQLNKSLADLKMRGFKK